MLCCYVSRKIKNKTNKIKFFSKHKQQKYDCETKVHLPHAKIIFFLHFFFMFINLDKNSTMPSMPAKRVFSYIL